MAVWSRIALEDAASASIVGNVRYGVPGNWTAPVARNGTVATAATAYGRTHDAALLAQIQSDAADARNRYVKIMVIGDQIAALSGSTGWRTQLYSQIAAQPLFRPTDFVGNAVYAANDGTSDPDHNGYAAYVATDLNKTSGTGTPGSGFLGDVRDVAAWFNEQAPDIVILHLGTNDCAAGAITTANITTAYAALLAAARAAKPSVIFYVCKLIKHTDATINGRITTLNTAIAAWALTVWTTTSPVEVIDMNASFNSGTMLQAGGLLPNATGATFMATQAFNALDPWLLKPPVYPFPTGQPFDRISIVLNGAWPAPRPIDLTNAVDWWTPSASGSSLMTGSNNKAGGGSIIVSQVGGDAGANQTDTANFTWTGGNNPASANGNHLTNTQTSGNGISAAIPAAKWPDWQYARVWVATGNPLQLTFTASMNDAAATTVVEAIGDGTMTENDGYRLLGSHYFDVRFASDKPGKTLTVTVLRNGGSMGYCIFSAIALYRGAPGRRQGLGAGIFGGFA